MGQLRSVLAARRGSPSLVSVISAQVLPMPSVGHSSALHVLFLFIKAKVFLVIFLQCLKMSILFVCGECTEFWSHFGTMSLNSSGSRVSSDPPETCFIASGIFSLSLPFI